MEIPLEIIGVSDVRKPYCRGIFKPNAQCKCSDILYVDDNEFNLHALTRVFDKLKLTFDTAFNG